MKKAILLLSALMLLTTAQNVVKAQDLTLSDVQNSGCLRDSEYGRRRANETEERRTMILLKEGNILTVQLFNFEATCETEDFIITPKVNNGDPCFVSINVDYIDSDADCICPYNISFTLHDLEPNCFFFSCWWYEGQVNLIEGEPLTLESITECVTIDGFTYIIDKVSHTATFISADVEIMGLEALNNLVIPSDVDYEGQKYIVTSIGELTLLKSTLTTSVTIPSSVTSIGYYAFTNCPNLTDVYCYAEGVPSTGDDVFKGTPIASATLHVPAGSIEEYKATSPWSGFGNIVALSLDLTQIRIKDRPGETLEYIGKIGSDFDTALDSLRILKNISSEIEKEPLEVLFDYDDRLFFGIIYGDCAMYSDVLDTEGYYYLRTWYSPEEPRQPLPFLEGNPIWEYKYEHMPMDAVLEDDGWNSILCWLDAGDRNYSYYFLGDKKEIEGKVYTMMGEVIRDREGVITLNHWLPVREEKGIVYAITDSLPGLIEYDYLEPPYLQQGNESVLYNFGAEIEEKLYPQNEGTTVKSFGTYQLMDGTECRVLKTTDGAFDLYEKLGYLHDQLTYGVMDPPSEIVYPIAADVHVKHLNAFYQNNVMLYKAPDAPDGLCVNDTCWTRDEAHNYAITYKADPYHEKVMSFIRQLQGVAEPITFTEGQMATIILPTEPEASKGKFYRLDRVEEGKIVFEQELQPRAHVPYIIVPSEDFSIDLNTLDLEGCSPDTVSIEVRFEGQEESQTIYFIGSYVSEELEQQEGCNIQFIDTTPDCSISFSEETGKETFLIGALRAYLTWDDPYNQGGTKGRGDKLEIVLRDYGTDIKTHSNSPLKGENKYDLSGKKLSDKPAHGLYIENGKKRAVR